MEAGSWSTDEAEGPIVSSSGPEGPLEGGLVDSPLTRHLREFVGVPSGSFEAGHLLGDPQRPVKIHHVPPTQTKPFHYLVTDGMRVYPQQTPPDIEDAPARVELLMGLDGHWPLVPERFTQPEVTWPVQLLASLAHFPTRQQAWFGQGHSLPNGDPPEPYVAGQGWCGVILLPPVSLPPEADAFEGEDGPVRVFGVVPVYPEELQLKLEQGTRALLERFDRHDINEVLFLQRPKVAGGLFDLLA